LYEELNASFATVICDKSEETETFEVWITGADTAGAPERRTEIRPSESAIRIIFILMPFRFLVWSDFGNSINLQAEACLAPARPRVNRNSARGRTKSVDAAEVRVSGPHHSEIMNENNSSIGRPSGMRSWSEIRTVKNKCQTDAIKPTSDRLYPGFLFPKTKVRDPKIRNR
jgi:hypothetical protein